MTAESSLLILAHVLVAATALAAVWRRRLPLVLCGLACVGLAAAGRVKYPRNEWIVAGVSAAGVMIAGLALQLAARASERGVRGRLASVRKRASELSRELAGLRAEAAENEAKSDVGRRLLRATGSLGVVATEGDMVSEFGGCLKSVFSFTSAHLVLLDEGDPDRASRSRDLLSGTDDEDQGPVELLRSQGLSPHYFGVKPGEGSVTAALPLRSEGKVVATVVIEGARFRDGRADVDELTPVLDLLANQFNLAFNRCKLHDEVVQMSRTDGLTDVRKKGFLLERAREELERVKGKDIPTSFVMFDIDHFKDYNDTYGHLIGDVVLRHVAGFLRANIRVQDLVGRYGGEEFLVVLVETPKDGGKVVAERIRRAVEEFRFPVEDKETGITISAGLATCPEDAAGLDAIIEKADEALYRAKQTGRNRVCVSGE